MSHKSKKAAPEATSEESVTTKSAESQEQPTTTPDGSTTGDVPVVAGAGTKTESQSITVTNQTSEVLQKTAMSPEEKHYLAAIGMKDAELGEVIKKPTERINKLFGSAIAHESKAKEERRLAQKEFNENLAYYYEVKQRLLNPKYRPDLNTGHERTEEDNLKNFGAKDWQEFNQKCTAYSLQHANAKLKEFAKSQGLMEAQGRGTTRRTGQNFPANSTYQNGQWNVIFELPDLPAGTTVAFAVWNGSQKDRDGRKYFSVWQVLE
jgi:hypothetical protein